MLVSEKHNVAHDLPAAPYPPLPKAWSDNKISISTFSQSLWMGSLKRLKPPHHTLQEPADGWLERTSLTDLQHLQVNERSISRDSLCRETGQIAFTSDGGNQANGQKMVANVARYVWCRLQLSSSLSINPEKTYRCISARGGGGGGRLVLVRIPRRVRRWPPLIRVHVKPNLMSVLLWGNSANKHFLFWTLCVSNWTHSTPLLQ